MTTNWKALKHHRGDASDIPKIVAAMLGGPDTPQGRADRHNHHLTLQDRLYREGQWVETAPAAIELLADAAVGEGQERERALWHIILLTTGGVNWAFAQGLPLKDVPGDYRAETLAATLAQLPKLMPLLQQENALFSARMAQLLGMLPGADSTRVNALQEAATSTLPEPTRCNACFSLGLIAAHQKVSVDKQIFEACMTDENPELLRAAAALGALWAGDSMSNVIGQALTELYPGAQQGPEFNWYYLHLLEWLPRDEADRFEIAKKWMEEWNERPFRAIETPTSFAFCLVSGWQKDSEAQLREKIEDFSEAEQTIIRLSAHRNQLGGSCGPSVPAPLRACRRWLGVDPPSLLEQPCSWENSDKMVWAAWWDHMRANELGGDGIPKAWSAATSFERLQLICEAKCRAYDLHKAVESLAGDDVTALAQECAAQEPRFSSWAVSLLKDIASQPDTGGLTHVGQKGHYARPLMRVLLSQGIELPNEIDALFRFDNSGDQKIIAQLPLERRRAILERGRHDWRNFQFIVPLLHIYPFKEYAGLALEGIATDRASGSKRANRFLQKVIPLCADHPEIAEALAEARAQPDWVPEN